MENLSVSECIDDFLDRYILFSKKKEKAHDQAVVHPTKLQLLDTEFRQLQEELNQLVRRFNRIADDDQWEKTIVLAADQHLLHFTEFCFAGMRAYET